MNESQFELIEIEEDGQSQFKLIEDKEDILYQAVTKIFKSPQKNDEIDSINENKILEKIYYRDPNEPTPDENLNNENNSDKTEQKISGVEESKKQIILDISLLYGKKNLKNDEIREESTLKKEEDNIIKNDDLANISSDKINKNKEQSNEQNKNKYIRFNQTLNPDKTFIKSEKELNEFISKEKEKENLSTKILNIPNDNDKYHLLKTNKCSHYEYYFNHNLENDKTRETEFDNKFIEIVEQKHFVIGENEFKIFNDYIENYEIKFKQKPIFKVIPLGKKRKRKSMDDLTRKKIKVHFCSEIILALNSRLKKLKTKKKFNLPQSMRTNVTKIENKKCLNMSLKDVLAERYFDKDKENDEICALIQEKNQKIFKILEKKGDGVINSLFDEKMENIFYEYLKSKQFQNSINVLVRKCNSYEYIYNYIKVAKNFVEFFNSKKSKKNN